MKILMVQDTFLPKIGGAEIHVLRLSKTLRDKGHQVTIATATPGDRLVEGFQVHRFPLLRTQGKRGLAALPFYMPTIFRLVRQHDIIHGHYTAMCSAVFGTVASWLKKPFVVTLHGYGTLETSVKDNFYMKLWRHLAFQKACKVIATSNEMAAVAQSFVPQHRIVNIPNAVDTSEFKPCSEPPFEELVRLATVRRLVPKNGVQFLIEALPLILRQSPKPIECWIIGDGPLKQYLEHRVKELSLGDTVRFWGAVSNDQIREILKYVHILVFPSTAESTSIAALEAMAMAKPIIASAVGGYPELIGDNERGILVHLFDSQNSNYNAPLTLSYNRLKLLANAVVELINNMEKAKFLGACARKYVENYHDWKVIAQRIEALYNNLLWRRQ